MRRIIYYVATSVDGYISGADDDISGFVSGGNGLDQYLNDLNDYDTVIMGRKTYEFGYKFGLTPGQRAYPHMTHYIFSNSLQFENSDEKVKIKKPDLMEIDALRQQDGSDIYLCGGGQFAGWLLVNKKIDILRIKLNPMILGSGVPLFGSCNKAIGLELLETGLYDNGLQIMTYKINYLE
jgi:dihydrofolate reductase